MNKMLNGNDPESCKILSDKARFNTYFRQFVRRKWLETKNMTWKGFSALCEGLDEIIIKPLVMVVMHNSILPCEG